jgi:hypothetical protein
MANGQVQIANKKGKGEEKTTNGQQGPIVNRK